MKYSRLGGGNMIISLVNSENSKCSLEIFINVFHRKYEKCYYTAEKPLKAATVIWILKSHGQKARV